jgi:hypothetical protein
MNNLSGPVVGRLNEVCLLKNPAPVKSRLRRFHAANKKFVHNGEVPAGNRVYKGANPQPLAKALILGKITKNVKIPDK